jgi:hypothetical protein
VPERLADHVDRLYLLVSPDCNKKHHLRSPRVARLGPGA